MQRRHVLAFLVLHLVISQGKEIVQVNLIWRHGDRSSRFRYPNDPYNDVWEDGPVQLTEIGMGQEYDLGLFLKSRYGHLLSEKYNENEIYIRSTDTDRSIMSAQCVVTGLYAPPNTTGWNGLGTPWRPFPIHVVDTQHDWLINVMQNPEKGCKNYDTLMAKLKSESDWYEKNAKKHGEFLKKMTNITGISQMFNIESISRLYDNLFCLKSNGYQLPPWASDEVMKILKYLSDMVNGLRWTDIDHKYRKTISKMRSGLILQKMLENMQNFINGTHNISVIGYSAHDSTVTPLLVSMGDYDWVRPSYSACVIIELYRDGDSYSVEFKFRNLTRKEPYDLTFFECGKGCNFKTFETIASGLIPGDESETLCGNQASSFSRVYLVVGLGVFVLAVMIFAAAHCRGKKKQGKLPYEAVPMDEPENGLFAAPL